MISIKFSFPPLFDQRQQRHSNHRWLDIFRWNGWLEQLLEYPSIDANVLTHSWILRADEVGEKVLYVSVHHGDNSGTDAEVLFGVSQAFEITVAIPENLVRIDPEYSPQSQERLVSRQTVS